MYRKPPERMEFPIFGYLAEFATVDELLDCVRRARAAGYREMEAYTPLPVHELTEALGYKSRLPAARLGLRDEVQARAGRLARRRFGFGQDGAKHGRVAPRGRLLRASLFKKRGGHVVRGVSSPERTSVLRRGARWFQRRPASGTSM